VKKRWDSVLKYIKQSDMVLLALCLFSSVYGIILIDSATRHLSKSNDVYIQIVALFIGLCLYIIFSLFDIDTIADKSKILYVASVLFICTLIIWVLKAIQATRRGCGSGRSAYSPPRLSRSRMRLFWRK
jgi:cell division protein FtsW (lipid II flippase)